MSINDTETLLPYRDNILLLPPGAQGIGAAYAVGFAKEGAKIVIADIWDGTNAVRQVEKSGSEAMLVKTCRKLGVSFWDSLLDRLSQSQEIPPLQELILHHANSP